MKVRWKWLIAFCLLIFIYKYSYTYLHSNPILALRTHIFFKGYPIKAITCEIKEDKYFNDFDGGMLEKEKFRGYIITKKPPKQRPTGNFLYRWKVKEKDSLYYGEYRPGGI
ncbi:MAG: hypothetical protein K0S51_1801 [Bacillales bacterium]|jgi:hypothetical protein|nr:hypothetical protein [Bacillales bacterium]